MHSQQFISISSDNMLLHLAGYTTINTTHKLRRTRAKGYILTFLKCISLYFCMIRNNTCHLFIHILASNHKLPILKRQKSNGTRRKRHRSGSPRRPRRHCHTTTQRRLLRLLGSEAQPLLREMTRHMLELSCQSTCHGDGCNVNGIVGAAAATVVSVGIDC
mmetsp:Transcript_30378/g.65577  ORF Transcript_30378/g.65577 Transcript_30378/m.65577 type:complete len:161 (-) Transcript_30378:1326-1808(-)